jgi:hypothetical protein
MGADALLQTFNSKLATVARVDLDDAVSEKEEEIARRKFRLCSLKLRVWNNAYRRASGIAADHHALYLAGTSTHVQRRRMTGASEARVVPFDIDHTVEHGYEDQRAGLLQNPGELTV